MPQPGYVPSAPPASSPYGAPPAQSPQPQILPPRPGILVDRRRNPKYFVDDFIYSVQLDQERLKCYYCCNTCPFCCCNQEKLANHTWMDIYTSGIVIGRPSGWCCIAKPARGVKVHYDDFEVFGKPPQVGRCCFEPYPFLCVNKCDCYGETLVMPGDCTCRLCPSWSVGLGNECTTCSLIPCISSWCLPISVMYGLREGEAEKVASLITAARGAYLNTYTKGMDMTVWQHPAVVAAAAAQPAPYGGHPSPQIVYANATTTPAGVSPMPMGSNAYEMQPAINHYPQGGQQSRGLDTNEPYNNPALSPVPIIVNNNQQSARKQQPANQNPYNSNNNSTSNRRSVSGDVTPRATFRLPDGDWRFDNDSRMYWSDEQQLYLRTTDGHFYDPHSTQWYNPDDGTWYHGN